jgi:hypothetical protein
MKTLRLVAAALLLPLLGACAMSHGHRNDRFDYASYLEDPNVTVAISNNTSSDVEVYALGPEIRYRLGLVATVGAHAFKIPHQLIRDGRTIRFVAVPLGGGTRYAIGTAQVEPGDYVEVTIDRASGSIHGRDRDRF